jgi:hypothetical protein
MFKTFSEAISAGHSVLSVNNEEPQRCLMPMKITQHPLS